jgi:hypothetical protein
MSRARHLYSSPDYPDRKFTATELRHECNVYDKFDVGTAVRAGKSIGGHAWAFAGHAEKPPKTFLLAVRREQNRERKRDKPPARDIRCWCPECAGRVFTVLEIMAHPAFPGGVVNPMRIGRIGEAVGHPLAYSRNNGTPAGTWHKAAPAREPQPVAAPGRAWVFNSSDEASRVFAINGQRIRAVDGPDVGVVT